MLFSIGIELPKEKEQAIGLVVPALCQDGYGCFSAADSEREVPAMAKEAILTMVEVMVENGYPVLNVQDKGVMYYREQKPYAYCDVWLMLDIDLSDIEGKPKRINVSMPDTLIARIDEYVKSSPEYKDRSHFLAIAAKHEMR
ncbi:type II toxin-antitoxin system HicB family antitoxin [Vibrio sp. V39_P1S14PM300]|uniref:type II toxin-antitoxin system HicB family antitoxin n=1 Tax=Vibrio sp. V39_P1S14PM300 TaxID=1938690 RepID=UPI0013734F0E|nr:type II toxin-antitoxin system HicB family antitoxin [Vibrio sp. V39_P1S14PM300]NAX23798.1 CopG family transcriptional regulator [Vibrio sp. V39_P1S14PM300]